MNTMDSKNPACEQSRRLMLDLAPSAVTRASLAQALAHIDSCKSCRAAMEDFDQISKLLAPAEESTQAESQAEDWADRAISNLPSSSRSGMRWAPMLRTAVAASIAVILTVGGYFLGRHNDSAQIATAPPSVAAPIAAADLSDRVRAFEQVNKAFDNRAGWMLVSDAASDVGLDPQPSSDRGMLLVRLTVNRRTGANLQTVSSADLAILPGRTAKLSLPFSGGRMLSYEISVGTGDPTRLGLLAELLPADGAATGKSKPLAALSTTLDMQSGAASPAGSFVTGNSDYELTVGFSKANLASTGTGALP